MTHVFLKTFLAVALTVFLLFMLLGLAAGATWAPYITGVTIITPFASLVITIVIRLLKRAEPGWERGWERVGGRVTAETHSLKSSFVKNLKDLKPLTTAITFGILLWVFIQSLGLFYLAGLMITFGLFFMFGPYFGLLAFFLHVPFMLVANLTGMREFFYRLEDAEILGIFVHMSNAGQLLFFLVTILIGFIAWWYLNTLRQLGMVRLKKWMRLTSILMLLYVLPAALFIDIASSSPNFYKDMMPIFFTGALFWLLPFIFLLIYYLRHADRQKRV